MELTDIVFYPKDVLGNELKNELGIRAMINTLSELKKYAKSQGFRRLRIHYERAKNSSSASPGKVTDEIFILE